MSHLNFVSHPGATDKAIPVAAIVLCAAVLVGVSGLWGMDQVLASMAPGANAQAVPLAQAAFLKAYGSTSASEFKRIVTSVPDASIVFAGRIESAEESAPTF